MPKYKALASLLHRAKRGAATVTVAPGEEFETSERIGETLVKKGQAEPAKKATASTNAPTTPPAP